ncbi:hypothetical protein ACH61_03073 [Rathayibacter tanaceti]|uniref:Uncharacterized protein n=1 Tax=Rathayibacter tanaceti TaxID=1671680 RepID=A0A162IZ04_9MICO|nr:hypothetical protein ACH61_03073 [Rathayibacter tanaceti]
MPNGSYQGAQTTTSAERSIAGIAVCESWPTKSTRSATPRLEATACSRWYSGSAVRASPEPEPPTTTSSASCPASTSRASASIAMPMPLRGTRRPIVISRARSPRGAREPRTENRSMSTPQGTTEMRAVGTPRPLSSNASSEQVATIPSARWPTPGSSQARSSGLVSSAPCCRRLTTPRAWKVCTTGTRRPVARSTCSEASSAATPDIQKWLCTRSGRSCSHSSARSIAKSPMNGNSSSFETRLGGPASMCTTSTPEAKGTRRGREGSSRRV